MRSCLTLKNKNPDQRTLFLAENAWQAMIEEVNISPKPGLVDRNNNGAHSDMDRALFHRSSQALKSYWSEIERAAEIETPVNMVLPLIRPLGIAAEKRMYEATSGINTHKGQIFCLGITLTAAARIITKTRTLDYPDLQFRILDETANICEGISTELQQKKRLRSHGEKNYHLYKSTGIRGEAENGFPSVREGSLPEFHTYLSRGFSKEEAALQCLLLLMTIVEDGNVLYRRGIEGLMLMRREASIFLQNGGMSQTGALEGLMKMDQLFIKENISPGGCADLLALTLFLHSLSSPNEI